MDDVRGGAAANKRWRTQQPPSSSSAVVGDDVDRISGLGDDVLVRILELLPDATDAVTTDSLSRRWRGLWTRMSDLRFASDSWAPEFSAARDAARFVAFVDHVLALRAAQTEPAAVVIQNLAVSLKLDGTSKDNAGRIVPPSVRASQGWIWYAVMHGLKSLDLELRIPKLIRKSAINHEIRSMTLNNLSSSAKMETMRLSLGHAIVEMPSSAVFSSLTDLSLEYVVVADGNIPLLARLASSACCPRLRKLRLRSIKLSSSKANIFITNRPIIKIEASLLLDLSIEKVHDAFHLTLTTPSLQRLRLKHCWDVDELTISAPNLVRISFDWYSQPQYIYIDDEMPGVRKLNKVQLHSHGWDDADDINKNAIKLLQNCTSLKYLDVDLRVSKIKLQYFDVIKDKIPQLPYVTSLTVRVSLDELHSLGSSVVSLLKECSNLSRLCLHLNYHIYFLGRDHVQPSAFSCKDHPGHLESQDIPLLANLEIVEFTGLTGTKCELHLVQLLLSSAPQLRKVHLGFNKDDRLQDTRDASKLLPLLLHGGGTWTPCTDDAHSYNWARASSSI